MATSLPLSPRDVKSQAPIWPVNTLEPSSSNEIEATPAEEKCAVGSMAAIDSGKKQKKKKQSTDPEREGLICCRELKGEDERSLVSPDVVRDIVIGLADGLTVPFALTAGLAALGDARLVVLAGLAELLAGALSMGVGGFLSAKAERDYFLYLRRATRERVARSCSGEMEREVASILGPIGVEGKVAELVAGSLMRSEEQMRLDEETGGSSSAASKYGGIDTGAQTGSKIEESEERGMSAFLIKFGEGLEETPVKRLYISAATIGLSYFIGGLFPLIPYFCVTSATKGLIISSILTAVILLIFGLFKTYFTGAQGGWRGYLWGSVSTALVGGAAAAAAYGLVTAMEKSHGA